MFRYYIKLEITCDLIKYQSFSLINEDALAQHLALLPLPLVDAPVGPPVLAVSLLQPALELSDVKLCGLACLVVVGGLARPVHLVVGPLPLVFVVFPALDAVPSCHVLLEDALEGAF